jgi:hypothetical protein
MNSAFEGFLTPDSPFFPNKMPMFECSSTVNSTNASICRTCTTDDRLLAADACGKHLCSIAQYLVSMSAINESNRTSEYDGHKDSDKLL